jgi:thymidylate kinase
MKIRKGLIIVFTGVDGSGKSTLTKNTFNWLKNNNYKIKKVYLGSGQGHVNIIIKFSNFLSFIGYKFKKSKKSQEINDNTYLVNSDKKIIFRKKPLLYTYYLIRAFGLFLVVKDNYRKIKKMQSNKNKGILSIADRFPQSQFKNINDGPKIEYYANKLNSNYLKKLANKEINYFKHYLKFPPDIVFKLKISPAVALKRKTEHTNIKYLAYKIDLINSIDFPLSKIINVNAENSLDNVINTVRSTILQELNK